MNWLGRESIAPVLIFFVGIPSLIFLHELGHYFAAEAYGYSARLSYAAVRFTMPRASYLGVENLVITAAGPFVNLFLAVVGVLGLRRILRVSELSKIQWYVVWILSVFASGGGRGISKVLSPANSDEAKMAEWFGLPGIAGPLIIGIPTMFLVFSMLRFHYRKRSLSLLFVGWAAGLVGMILWLRVIGPAVLP